MRKSLHQRSLVTDVSQGPCSVLPTKPLAAEQQGMRHLAWLRDITSTLEAAIYPPTMNMPMADTGGPDIAGAE